MWTDWSHSAETTPTRVGWSIDLGVDRPSDARVAVGVCVAAVLTDVAVRSGVASIGGVLLVLAVCAIALASRRVANPQARALFVLAPLFGVWLAARASPVLVFLDIVAVGGLLVLGASLARGRSLFDLSIPALVARGLHAVPHGLAGPGFVLAPLAGLRSSAAKAGGGRAVLRGLTLAVPVTVVLGVLLASGDAVFAGFFRWWDLTGIIDHAVLLVIGAWGMAGLLRLASATPMPALRAAERRLGALEATIVVGSMVGLFAAFAVAQLVALSEGGRHVLDTAGLTYAEYARSGFFQLLAVAVITLVVLLGLRAVADLEEPSARRRFTVLAEVAVVLTLVIVGVALRRLDLYEDAFGLTLLRLFSQVFAGWVGAVFVLLGLKLAGVGASRQWFAAAAGALGLLALLGLNVVNPEAVVVRHNVDHAARTGRFDPSYLAELSDDAVPTLVDALPGLDPANRADAVAALCAVPRSDDRGFFDFNGARDAAVEARNRLCS